VVVFVAPMAMRSQWLFASLACAWACAPVFRPVLPHETPSPRGAVRVDPEETRECLRLGGRYDAPPDRPLEDPELAAFLDEVPPEVRRVAQAAGVEPLLATLLHMATSDASDANEAARLELVMRLSSLEIQITALLFEADCVGDQMEAVLDELERRQRAREVALTVSSILVGAVAATTGGIWELRSDGGNGPAALMIGGGAASAALGLAAFIPERRAVVFPHPRNLLAPIVDGEDPQGLFPAFVFRMLTLPDPHDGRTLRDEILDDWERILDDEVPSEQQARARQVLYGEGGLYDERLVDVRERMFDVLESHVNAIDRELELLYRYSAPLIETRPSSAPAPE
jgi:hypothetical protein